MSCIRLLLSVAVAGVVGAGELANPGFEEVADGKPSGWAIRDSLTALVEGQAAGGEHCLRIVDDSREKGTDIQSARFPVAAEQLCVLRLQLFLEAGDPQGLGVYLKLWDADGKELVEPRERQAARPSMTLGEWTEATTVYAIPAGVVQAAVWLHTFSSAVTTCRVDDLAVAQMPSEVERKAGDWSGGEPVLLPEGGMAVRWTHLRSPRLTRVFEPPADWSEMGMLRFRLHSAKATGAGFMLILDSENPATEGSDYYSFGIRQDWDGWREFRLPLAELGQAREPLGRQTIRSATFTASGWSNTPHPDGVILLADWNVTDEHRFGPTMDDAAFFAALDLDLPALAAVKAAVDRGDMTAARKAFADHIRNRTWPTWRIDWRQQPMRGVKVPGPEEDKDPESWDYYSTFITVDWQGWRHFVLKKSDFPSRSFVEGKGWQGKQPIGWHWIKFIQFSASGWGLTPDSETVLHFDDIRLVGPERSVTLEDFEAGTSSFSGLEHSTEQARSGTGAGRWANLAANSRITNWGIPHDWTDFEQMEFWLHAREATGARFVLVLDSDVPRGNAKAEKLLQREFSYSFSNRAWPIVFEGPIDWHANPTEGVNRTHLWNESLNRHFHFRDLSEAYWESGDDRYAQGIADHVMDWIRRNPPPLMSSGNGSAMINCTWQTLTTGIRMEGIWPDALYRCLGSPAFTDEVVVTMVKSCADQANHLVRNPTGGNWLTEESMGVYTVGMLFPEYRQAREWRRVAIERLNRQLDEDVYPDGMEVELAAGYSNWVISNFVHLLERADAAGLRDEIPEDFLTRLERAYNYHLYAMMPNGAIPGLNDSGPANVRGYLEKAFEFFPRRTDFLFGATLGARGTEPAQTSYAFPYSGHFVMRSGWDADAVYALLDSGPFGYGHQHEDKLHFVLYAHGRQLLLDPGNFSYDRSPARHYVLGTHGHNTILVDGQGQARRGNRETYVWPKPWDTPTPRGDDTLWQSTPEADFVRGTYTDGYGPRAAIRVRHTRRLLFAKPDFFLLLDTLEPEDDREHTYTSLFHIDDT
ncbi:MAG: alginate lyase family protein, partial [Lentisphaeria bacterium]|nr:alginate lyase family protein [Lentisphaeria bacterium]